MSTGARIEPVDPGELQRQNEALRQQVTELEGTIRTLRAELEQFKRRQQRQAAPFSKDERVAEPKRPGRKAGQGVFRSRAAPSPAALSEPPIAVPVTLAACPRCGGDLVEERVDFASVTDLPAQPQVQVRQYRVSVARCTDCGRRVRGGHPDLASHQQGASAHRLGPRLLSAAHALHYDHGVPVRRVPAILQSLTGAQFTQGALTQDALRQAAGPVGRAEEELRATVRQAASVHTDDTGWRIGGVSAFLMVFTTAAVTTYQIRHQHRNEEVQEVIPADYDGVLVTDRGRSYDAAALAKLKQQKCLAHLQRSISAVVETKWGRGRSFGRQLRRLFREALALWHAAQAGPVPDFAAQTEALQARLTDLLRARSMPDPDNQRLLDQLRWQHERGHLLRFLTEPAVAPTNNAAERALRPAVIARKVSQCSKTGEGANAFAAFVSVARTARQNGQSVTDRFVELRRPSATHAPVSLP